MLHLLPISEFIWQKTVSPELQSAGYLTVSRVHVDGRWRWDYSVVSVPPDAALEIGSKNTIPKKFRHCISKPEKSPDETNKSSELNQTHYNHGCVYLGDMPPELRDTFWRVAHDIPYTTQQDIADELVGQIKFGKVEKPEALLRTLTRAARTDDLTLDFARKLRANRKAKSSNTILRNDTKLRPDPRACAIGSQFFGEQTRKRLAGEEAS
jgi:hypothetical protein